MKLIAATIIASCGFAALACGGGTEEESNASNVPVAGSASSSAPKATAHAIVAARPTGVVVAATATATAPTESPLPAPFNTANDARKAADSTLATLLATKETNCDVIAAELAKFTTDNSTAYSVWNIEYSKLSPEQMRSRALGGPDLAASLGGGGGFKVCLDQKNPKLGLAMRSFLGVATPGK
jgi:hypothetical protein